MMAVLYERTPPPRDLVTKRSLGTVVRLGRIFAEAAVFQRCLPPSASLIVLDQNICDILVVRSDQ